MLNRTWWYMVDQVAENLPSLPTWLSDLIGEVGLELALDALIDLTKPSTGSYFYEELQGLAAGGGVDYATLARVHLIGELTQGDCSMIGAWGSATAGGKTLQLRALDWDTEGPFRDYPAVTVYHPATPGAHPFTNVGLLGFIGAFTGQSSEQLGVSDIGVSYPDKEHFGSETFAGIPFVFLLRDVLEFDKTVFDSVAACRAQTEPATSFWAWGMARRRQRGALPTAPASCLCTMTTTWSHGTPRQTHGTRAFRT